MTSTLMVETDLQRAGLGRHWPADRYPACWQAQEMRDGSRVAGIRTFTLIGFWAGFAACWERMVTPLCSAWGFYLLPFPSAFSNGSARRATAVIYF